MEAYQNGEPRAAKKLLDHAFSELLNANKLDHVTRAKRRDTSLELLGEALGSELDLVDVYRQVLRQSRERRVRTVRSERPTGARGPCRLESVARRDLETCVRERAEQVLYELWQDPQEIPESFYEAVGHQLELLSTRRRGWVKASLGRGEPFREMMTTSLEDSKVPAMLRYLSMIESGYEPEIKSKAGARGIWEFMPATARIMLRPATSDRSESRAGRTKAWIAPIARA